MTEINGGTLTMAQFESLDKSDFAFDIETYPNFFLVSFENFNGDRVYFRSDLGFSVDVLQRFMQKITIYGFNSAHFDLPVCAALRKNMTMEQVEEQAYEMGQEIINFHNGPAWMVNKKYGLKRGWETWYDHYDIKDPTFGAHSLKFYGAVIDAPTIQDLPYPHHSFLNQDEKDEVFKYCWNDVNTTISLRTRIDDAITIRKDLGARFGVNLVSQSDAKVAENVLLQARELATGEKLENPSQTGAWTPQRPMRYDVPEYLTFQTDVMKDLIGLISETEFFLRDTMKISLGPLAGRIVSFKPSYTYKFGIGGLHSQENRITHRATEDMLLIDIDVASYYPNIIMRNGYHPENYGPMYLDVYGGIIKQRITAKRAGDKLLANGLKIPLNSSFGKLAEQHSALFSPNLSLGICLTGQLGLLMLIESLNIADFEVVSANTDGVVTKIPVSRLEEFRAIYADWEERTGYEMEETHYSALFSRDVNSYVAIGTDGSVKAKGEYSSYGLGALQAKCPNAQICKDAVIAYLKDGVSARDTIMAENDIRKFLVATNVKGGAIFKGEKVGKVARFYYSDNANDTIFRSDGRSRVPNATGVNLAMSIPSSIPDDLSRDAYISKAETMINHDFDSPQYYGDLFD